MSEKVYIETEECVGCQSCVELCPKVFGFDEETEKAFILNPEGNSQECIDEAIETCPAECIHWGSRG
jgi:ferredoxin